MAKSWHRFDQDFLSFAVKHVREDANASCVPVWPCHRVHETRPEQIFCERKDRDRISRLLGSAKCPPPPVMMTSTRALTSSAAYCETRSKCGPMGDIRP